MTAARGRIGCIVLAAGSGTRFGSDKRLAPFGNSTLLAHTLGTIASAFTQRILVLRAGDEAIGTCFADDWHVIYAADASNGMGRSLAAAIGASSDWDGAVIGLGDMPYVRTSTYVTVRDHVTRASLVVPHYDGRRGNPVGIGATFFPELLQLQGDQGARALMQQHAAAVTRLDLDDRGILQDVDTPAALAGGSDRSEAGC